jgi:hypothetical protein
MKLKKTIHKFINKPIYKITDENTIKYIKNQILSKWNTNKKKSFPGVQPVSLERKNFKELHKKKFNICPKLDGERFFLFSCQVPNNNNTMSNITVIIDRTFSFYIITQLWKHINSYKKQILFDGELIKNGNFIIHDVYITEGENVMNEPFNKRIELGNDFFNQGRWDNNINLNTLKLKMKTFYSLDKINKLFNTITEESDGIIFYPINKKVGCRTQFDLFKWKTHNTIDFKLDQTNDNFTNLITWDKDKEIIYKMLNVKWDVVIYPHNSIVECNVIIKKHNDIIDFTPIMRRVDKSTGNSKFTIDRTIENIKENITQEELIKEFAITKTK